MSLGLGVGVELAGDTDIGITTAQTRDVETCLQLKFDQHTIDTAQTWISQILDIFEVYWVLITCFFFIRPAYLFTSPCNSSTRRLISSFFSLKWKHTFSWLLWYFNSLWICTQPCFISFSLHFRLIYKFRYVYIHLCAFSVVSLWDLREHNHPYSRNKITITFLLFSEWTQALNYIRASNFGTDEVASYATFLNNKIAMCIILTTLKEGAVRIRSLKSKL